MRLGVSQLHRAAALPTAAEQLNAARVLFRCNNIPVTQLSLTRATFVTGTAQGAGMENGILKLTLDSDGLGADLLLATTAWSIPADEVLTTLRGMNLRTRVKTHARGSKGWRLQVRVSEYERLHLSANRAQDVLRAIGRMLVAKDFTRFGTTRAA